MKNRSFSIRIRFACRGVFSAWRTEKSFRTQTAMVLGVIGVLGALQPEAIWWAVVFLAIGAVLAAELFNTALERVVDLLHPDVHPIIGVAKDCAAGAVLVLSTSALLIFGSLLVHHFRP